MSRKTGKKAFFTGASIKFSVGWCSNLIFFPYVSDKTGDSGKHGWSEVDLLGDLLILSL